MSTLPVIPEAETSSSGFGLDVCSLYHQPKVFPSRSPNVSELQEEVPGVCYMSHVCSPKECQPYGAGHFHP